VSGNRTELSAVLVSYSGLPSSFDSLMPDNGLASLAGSLKREGWRVRILDFATTDMAGRLVPVRHRRRLKWLLSQFVLCRKFGLSLGKRLSDAFQDFNRILLDHARAVEAEIADEIVYEVQQRNARFVGFKLWTGAGQEGTHRIAARLKKACPEIKVFGGGPHVECFQEHVLADLSPTFDAVALGEGEQTIVELARHAVGRKALEDIPGIAFRGVTGGGEPSSRVVKNEGGAIRDLDTLASPCYDTETYPAMAGDRKLRFLMIDESRGCPFSCNFCFHPVKSGNVWRTRSPGRVVDLMREISSETGSRVFRLAGSNPPQDHRVELAHELIRGKTAFEYVSFGHTRSENEQFDLLRESGCVSLFFGVESGSERILDEALNKRTSVKRIASNLLGAKRAGIMTSASLIVPCPFDDSDSLQSTVDLMAKVRPHGISIYLPIVVPRTRWFENPEAFGIEFSGDKLRSLMRYQVRFLMPPPLWDPLPYRICGRDFAEMVKCAMWMDGELGRRRLLPGMNDSLLVLGKYLRMPAKKVRNLNRKMFMTADVNGIESLVRDFNRSVGTGTADE